MADYMESYKQTGKEYRNLIKESGNTMRSFGKLHSDAIKDGALTKKEKELMSVAISVSIRCEGCITSHVASAIEAGATMEELAEAVNVSILMSGGPGTVYGGKALAFAKEYMDNH